MSQFPNLPIVTIDPPRKTQVEKYGGLFYLGIGGIVVLALLVGGFGYGVWSMRSVWIDIYLLNDPKRSEVDRVNAAVRLANDERVTQRQRWDLALSRVPPDIARYILAESLTSELANDAPREYGMAVARSEGWPDWLRLLLARPIAIAAAEGTLVDRESLDALVARDDPVLRSLANFAISYPSHEATRDNPDPSEFAKILDEARTSQQPRTAELLDQATVWIRVHHPGAIAVWKGWSMTPQGLVRDEPGP